METTQAPRVTVHCYRRGRELIPASIKKVLVTIWAFKPPTRHNGLMPLGQWRAAR